jgi:pyridoxamine 5'-phosphate oxidase
MARARRERGARASHLHGSLNCAQQPADLRLHSYRILPMNIAHLRQEYMRAGLSEAHALADPLAQFQRWFEEAQGAELPLANAMTLATVTPQGAPDARVVLLKGVDGGGFVFYTNYDSRKGRQLAARPEACLVFLWTQLERQVRIEGKVARVPSTDSDKYFLSRPVGARLSASASAQSETVSSREFLESQVEKIKARFGENPPRPPHWGGYRVIPAQIEFWQGRENRLHDRLLYRRNKDSWTIERLAP